MSMSMSKSTINHILPPSLHGLSRPLSQNTARTPRSHWSPSEAKQLAALHTLSSPRRSCSRSGSQDRTHTCRIPITRAGSKRCGLGWAMRVSEAVYVQACCRRPHGLRLAAAEEHEGSGLSVDVVGGTVWSAVCWVLVARAGKGAYDCGLNSTRCEGKCADARAALGVSLRTVTSGRTTDGMLQMRRSCQGAFAMCL